jgi:hypothetical protein
VFWPRPGWPLGFWWCDLCRHRWPRPARSVCDPEVLLGSVGPVLSRWPVLPSMAGALVDGLCCGRWSVLRSMAGAAVDGRCCRRWPVLWSMAGAVAAAGRGSGRVLWGCSGFWWCDRRWHRWPRPARSVCDPEVLMGSVWPVLWSMAGAVVDGRCCGRWPVLWSMAGAVVDGRCCGRWPVLRSMAGAVAAAGVPVGGWSGLWPRSGWPLVALVA